MFVSGTLHTPDLLRKSPPLSHPVLDAFLGLC